MNTYEVTLKFYPVHLTVEANDSGEALDKAIADFGLYEEPEVDEFMSSVDLI